MQIFHLVSIFQLIYFCRTKEKRHWLAKVIRVQRAFSSRLIRLCQTMAFSIRMEPLTSAKSWPRELRWAAIFTGTRVLTACLLAPETFAGSSNLTHIKLQQRNLSFLRMPPLKTTSVRLIWAAQLSTTLTSNTKDYLRIIEIIYFSNSWQIYRWTTFRTYRRPSAQGPFFFYFLSVRFLRFLGSKQVSHYWRIFGQFTWFLHLGFLQQG